MSNYSESLQQTFNWTCIKSLPKLQRTEVNLLTFLKERHSILNKLKKAAPRSSIVKDLDALKYLNWCSSLRQLVHKLKIVDHTTLEKKNIEEINLKFCPK